MLAYNKRLLSFLGQYPVFTFNGKRAYRYLSALHLGSPTDDWFTLLAVREPRFGMYGDSPEHEEAYAAWVQEHGSDPWYDEVLADQYELTLLDCAMTVKVVVRDLRQHSVDPPAGDGLPRLILEVSACS